MKRAGVKDEIEWPQKARGGRARTKQNQRSKRPEGLREQKDPQAVQDSNIFVYMPYLDFETDSHRREMQEAIKRAELSRSGILQTPIRAKTYDDLSVQAYLGIASPPLHVRRTLDQSFYHNIDTRRRDQDTVLYRYQNRLHIADPKSLW